MLPPLRLLFYVSGTESTTIGSAAFGSRSVGAKYPTSYPKLSNRERHLFISLFKVYPGDIRKGFLFLS
nr:hypothetical protein Q903MT_gene483 [Picea sitchensis]